MRYLEELRAHFQQIINEVDGLWAIYIDDIDGIEIIHERNECLRISPDDLPQISESVVAGYCMGQSIKTEEGKPVEMKDCLLRGDGLQVFGYLKDSLVFSIYASEKANTNEIINLKERLAPVNHLLFSILSKTI
ncbi:hypothetical protein SNEBB_003570 [Seison nebaliae]|nr:hypothetical protein SNEBB_003570 [Seison nebaliae]